MKRLMLKHTYLYVVLSLSFLGIHGLALLATSPGALAGQLCTDARTKDYENYPKQCVRHFEIDTPFEAFSLCPVRPSQGFWGTGEQGHLFQGNRGTKKGQILRGTKTILGNREHKKTNFRFLGNRGTSQFISGEQGNRYPPGRAAPVKK